MTNKDDGPVLSEKVQEIIAVGASVAAGCLPCTKFHLRAASDVGAGEGEILQAVRVAVEVRRAATEIMAKAGGLPPAEAEKPGPDPEGGRTLVQELVSISAAYAVNCPTSLGTHMAAARALGATDEQMFEAVKIACAIRDVAVQKAKAAAGAVFGVSEEQAAGCDCGEEDGPAPDSEECDCRTGDDPESHK
jgi:AhpD family alkylhydroperoxidase